MFSLSIRAWKALPHKGFASAILVLVVLRLMSVVFLPGFYVDEAATGAHVASMVLYGTDAHGQAWPGFTASLDWGYTTPVYLYPLTAWAHIFGFSVLALRYFSQCTTLLALGMLALALRFWLPAKTALFAAIIGLALPWGWLQGNIAWDPALVPFFVVLSFLCFSVLLFSNRPSARYCSVVLLPASLVALSYVYPPCRVVAPIIFITYFGALYHRKRVSLRVVVSSYVFAIILAIPLLLFIAQPAALERSQQLSVFHDAPFLLACGRLLSHLLLLMNPVFLFFYGDYNLRHSPGIGGMLGLGALIPVATVAYVVVRRKLWRSFSLRDSNTHLLVLIATIGVCSSVFGSALTNGGQPNSLRSCAAWVFFVIIIVVGWTLLSRVGTPLIRSVTIGIFILSTVFYMTDLFLFYPSRAADSFDASVYNKLMQNQQVAYPELGLRYYQLLRAR